MFPILETDTSSCPALEHRASLTHRNNQDHKLASQPAARTNKVRLLEIMEIIMWNLQSAFYAAIRRWLLLQSSRTIYQCLREILFALDASLELPLLAFTTFPIQREK